MFESYRTIAVMASLEKETARFLKAWMQVRQIVQAANFNRFHRAGLSATQFMTLNVIPTSGLILSELARKLNLSPASLKKTIDSLEERKLVCRQPLPNDARKINILSTPQGKRFQNAASGEFHSFMAGLFTAMSRGERAGLLTGLERLVQVSASLANSTGKSEALTRHDADAPPAKRSTRQSRPR